jgi:hypothetical protein
MAMVKDNQKTGIAAGVAIIAAILSIIVTFAVHPGWGLVLAVIAVLAGVLGFLMAASPRVGGGILSILSIVLGVFDIGLAVLGIVGVIVL